jgi:hypothetical protein
MNYWINSNSGDYITENNGRYQLTLLSRWDSDENYLKDEIIEITPIQFESMRGFIPIKQKKLYFKLNRYNYRNIYAPTISDGSKGKAIRTEVPTIQEAREYRLKELGL